MRLHVVDGTFELFRAHYSKRPDHQSRAGQPVKATVGLIDSLLVLLGEPEEDVTHVAVAFDNPIRSFRNDLFPAYKSDEGMEPELRNQFDLVEAAVAALGVVVWSMDRFEADDALATAAFRFADQVDQVRLLTPDKDLGQCLDTDRVVMIDRIRRRTIDQARFEAERGFGVASMPDYLALVGDDADGIPGLSGFGAKSASTLLGTYPHLEDIPKGSHQWAAKPRGAERLSATLNAQFDDAVLYRQLATLVRDVPLAEDLEALRYRGAPQEGFSAWCEEMDAGSLLDRPKVWRSR